MSKVNNLILVQWHNNAHTNFTIFSKGAFKMHVNPTIIFQFLGDLSPYRGSAPGPRRVTSVPQTTSYP